MAAQVNNNRTLNTGTKGRQKYHKIPLHPPFPFPFPLPHTPPPRGGYKHSSCLNRSYINILCLALKVKCHKENNALYNVVNLDLVVDAIFLGLYHAIYLVQEPGTLDFLTLLKSSRCSDTATCDFGSAYSLTTRKLFLQLPNGFH